jgi:dUTP pyrophosphatase
MVPDLKVKVRSGGRMPTQSYYGDAGFDLYCSEEKQIPHGLTQDVDCGIDIELPEGYWARVVGRSSTIRKRGLLVVEGIIDNGYRGPIFVAVHNPGQDSGSYQMVREGDRLAQLIVHKLETPRLVQVDGLSASARGVAGFGSTGI